MSADVKDGASVRELLGLSPDATDAEVRETYRELERYLAPSSVPRRLQEWAARERAVIGKAVASAPVPTPRASGPRSRPRDLPDFFDEDIREDAPAPRQGRDATKRVASGRAGAPAARRPTSGLFSWRSAVLILALGIVVAVVLIASLPPGGVTSGTTGANTSDTSAAPTPIPLDQAQVAELTKAVQANPNDTNSLFQLGEMNMQAENWQASIDWFNKLLAVDPSNSHARTDVGTASYNLGRYDDARAAWEEVVRRDPSYAQAYFNLGFYYLNGPTPDQAKAIAEWQKVIDVAPGTDLANTAKTHIDALK